MEDTVLDSVGPVFERFTFELRFRREDPVFAEMVLTPSPSRDQLVTCQKLRPPPISPPMFGPLWRIPRAAC